MTSVHPPLREENFYFAPLTEDWLASLMPIEQQTYSHPWSRGNFVDALAAGYHAQLLLDAHEQLIGYYVAMPVLDEVHLLNITVAPSHQGQGWSRVLLDALTLWARQRQTLWIWLEVRQSNIRARAIYEKYGYQQVAQRKNYYPATNGEREHAIIMSLKLWP